MRTRLLAGWLVLLAGLCASARAQEIKSVESFDPAYFMAGLLVGGTIPARPPHCYTSFLSADGQHRAEMFLAMAQIWVKDANVPEPLTHFRSADGHRFVIENWPLATSLRNFFLGTALGRQLDPTTPPTFSPQEVVIAGPVQKLSFLAGVYAGCHDKDQDVFHGPPGVTRDVIMLLLLEGCEVSGVTLDRVVPATMTFKVKPTAEVARIFALVNQWRPAVVRWAVE